MSTGILFFLLALVSEIAGTIGGFGSSVFFVPLAGLLFNFKAVLMLTAVLHNFSNVSKLYLFRKHIDYRLLLVYGIPSTVFVMVGAYLTNLMQFKYMELALGFFLIAFSLFVFLKPAFQLPVTTGSAIAGGSVSGFLAGFIGTGGAVRGMSLAAFNLQKSIFIATSAAIDFFVDLSRTVIYARNGYFQMEHLVYIPLLLIAAFGGSYIGKVLLTKISQEQFRKIVLAFLFAIGVVMLFKNRLS